jgi:polar amino acid transport system permease protein
MGESLQLMVWGEAGWGDEIVAGAWLTVRLSLATVPFGLLLGFAVALMKRSASRWVRRVADAYTTIFRGLPELLTIFIIYYGGQILAREAVGLVVPGARVEITGFLAGMIALGIVFSAYAGEVFVSAFQGIPKGQWEGAEALGLHRFQVMRLVIAPQLIRLALPGLANLWLILLKDTSLVSVISLDELTRMSSVAARVTREPFFFYGIACLTYLAMSIISSIGIAAVERWSERGRQTGPANPAAAGRGRR